MNDPILLSPPASQGPVVDQKHWKVTWRVEKFHGKDADEIAGCTPDEVVIKHDNLLLNSGINLMLKLLCGLGGTAYSSGNAYIRVGSGTTAAAAAQTDLQGGSKTSKAMDSGYPTVSSQTSSWKASFGSSDGNHAWEEVGVANGSGTPDGSTTILLNRKVQSFGTKNSGSTWTMQVDITIT